MHRSGALYRLGGDRNQLGKVGIRARSAVRVSLPAGCSDVAEMVGHQSLTV